MWEGTEQAVRPGQITKLYRDLVTSGGRRGTGLSPRTVSYVHAVLRKEFGDAVLVERVIPSNLSNVRSGLSGVPRTWRHLDGHGASGLLKAAQTLFTFFHLTAYSGARRDELLNLRWRDVDLDGASIQIKGSASFIAGERIKGTTKSGRIRVVSIDPERPDTVSSLTTPLIKLHNQPKDGTSPVEPLPHARLHDLRHIHAATPLLAGVPVHVVAARLGHTDPSITLRVYAHVVNQQLAEQPKSSPSTCWGTTGFPSRTPSMWDTHRRQHERAAVRLRRHPRGEQRGFR